MTVAAVYTIYTPFVVYIYMVYIQYGLLVTPHLGFSELTTNIVRGILFI